MTVEELMHFLEQFDPDTEVRLAIQPRYPLEYSITSAEEVVIDMATEDNPDAPSIHVIYLTEGHQIGYLPGQAAEQLGW